MLEKRLAAVPAQLFTANGTSSGMITIAANACSLFKVKQGVYIAATGLPNLHLEVKEIANGIIYVGPFASSVKSATPSTPSRPAVASSLTLRSDISAYTTTLGANIFADEQGRPKIDYAEALRAAFDEEPAVALRTILVDDCGNKYNASNPLPVAFDGTVTIGDVSIVEGGNTMVVNPDGSINVQGNTTVSGTVNTNLNGLNAFQTSQYTVGLTAIQLTPTPLVNRSSLSIKVIATSSSDMVYIGNSNAVTASTGYFLFNGDTIQMDLTPLDQIYAIGTSPGQIVAVLEIGA